MKIIHNGTEYHVVRELENLRHEKEYAIMLDSKTYKLVHESECTVVKDK